MTVTGGEGFTCTSPERLPSLLQGAHPIGIPVPTHSQPSPQAQIFRPAAERLAKFCRRPVSLLSVRKTAEASLPAKDRGRPHLEAVNRPGDLSACSSSWSTSSRSSSWRSFWLPFLAPPCAASIG